MKPELQRLVERDVHRWPEMPARPLHVLGSGSDLDVEVAAGLADVRTGEPVVPGSRFRIASVTKPFFAAATLRLVEDGRLGLETTLEESISAETLQVLRDGGYETGSITLRHLLTHTSGIYDFAASAYDASIVDGFDQAIAADPGRRWTRLEQIRFAMDHGRPYGKPGEVYGYADTNASLVAEIVERVTDVGMGPAIRDLVGFERLGLLQTYHDVFEPEPADAPPWSHQYERDVDVTDIDPSVDLYGGGGLVSTCGDLARFLRALLQGEVFQQAGTSELMTTRSEGVPRADDLGTQEDPADHAMFLYRAVIGGYEWWGHDGWWGTTAFSCPTLDLTIVTSHQQAYMPRGFRRTDLIADVLATFDGR